MGPNVFVKIHYHSPEYELLDDTNSFNKDKKKSRLFYSSKQADRNDYVKYVDSGAKAGEVYDYVAYAGNEGKSSGAFSKNGLLTKEEKEDLRKHLRETKSVIWDMLISFEEGFGKDKMKSYGDARALLIDKLPKFFRQNSMNYENIEWFAGLHMNTDNRHIHLSFFEKEPQVYQSKSPGLHYHRGELKKLSINELKINIEEELTNNKFFFESYRRNLMNDVKNSLNPSYYQERQIRIKLLELYRKLPKNGRLSYDSKNMDLFRPLINEITDLFIAKDPKLNDEFKKMRDDLEAFDNNRKSICESQKINPDRYLLKNKYMDDFYRRVGNQVIKYAEAFGHQATYEGLSTKAQKVQRNIEKQNRMKLLKRTARLAKNVEFEAQDVFLEYQGLLAKAQHDRLVEAGEIEVE